MPLRFADTYAEGWVLVQELERRVQVLPHAACHAANFNRLPLAACAAKTTHGIHSDTREWVSLHRTVLYSSPRCDSSSSRARALETCSRVMAWADA